MPQVLRVVSPDRSHPRDIAKVRVAQHRLAKPPRLTQKDIDGDGRNEERIVLVMAQTVRFYRRSLFAKLCGWLRK